MSIGRKRKRMPMRQVIVARSTPVARIARRRASSVGSAETRLRNRAICRRRMLLKKSLKIASAMNPRKMRTPRPIHCQYWTKRNSDFSESGMFTTIQPWIDSDSRFARTDGSSFDNWT